MPVENRYYTCEICGKNFGEKYEDCKVHEAMHQKNKVYKIIMSKDASEIKTEFGTGENPQILFNFVYQSSSYFYIFVDSKDKIKAAFEKLKAEAIRYYNIVLERDKKSLSIATENMQKLEVNIDEKSMRKFYF